MECQIKPRVKPSCIEIPGIVKYYNIFVVSINSIEFIVDTVDI